ncbi:MAG: 3-dehydroquinate synthase [Deltaproteobacteria bacterium HGW-Deltaproteobacteria-11]|nr:MAG: 3-dehydroquinate synthase [Deltaproteobacteria bacterium HGW-Deltaproteobacteria-11]
MKKLKVHLDRKQSQSYEICIGYDIFDRIAMMIANSRIAGRYVIVTDDCVGTLYGETLLAHLTKMGVRSDLIVFPAGERSKNVQSVLDIAGKLLDLGADRKSALVALGGGVAGDLAGFIASVYMRGVPCIQVPTTLMAQVDSSIGGKTAIDLPQGKNLLGTFCQPVGVFIDIKCLDTLPDAEYQNGLAEVVKYGIIDSESLFRQLEADVEAIRSRNRPFLEAIIQRVCTIKKGIVEMDEREQGLRRILNFGHTLGHALESASEYGISHGNAVAVGMIAAARMSQKLYGLPAEDRERIEGLIASLSLACGIPEDLATEDILSGLQRDKKKDGDTIHFVLLKKIGLPFINGGVPDDLLRETIEGLRT